MKLIICSACKDVRALRVGDTAVCDCGQSWGQYLKDGLNAEYGGLAIPMAFCNESLALARRKRRKDARHPLAFVAFLVEDDCPTFREGDS